MIEQDTFRRGCIGDIPIEEQGDRSRDQYSILTKAMGMYLEFVARCSYMFDWYSSIAGMRWMFAVAKKRNRGKCRRIKRRFFAKPPSDSTNLLFVHPHQPHQPTLRQFLPCIIHPPVTHSQGHLCSRAHNPFPSHLIASLTR